MSRYTAEYGPNVEQILCAPTRVIRGKVPMQVRRELSAAVKAGVLGRLPKEGLKPEVYFHPDHKHGAIERQKSEAAYSASLVAKAFVSPADVRAAMEKAGIDPLQVALNEADARRKCASPPSPLQDRDGEVNR